MVFAINKVIFCMQVVAKIITALQNEYTLRHEAVKVTDYNSDYLEDPKIKLFWYNRTTKAFNGSTYLKEDLGLYIAINVTVYKFVNNQFRFYPVEFRKNFCEFLEMNLFGARDIAMMVDIADCPITEGAYNLTNIVPDVSKFPPYLIPNGRYKIYASFYNYHTYLLGALWQGEVQAVQRIF